MVEVAIAAVEAVFDWKAYLKEEFDWKPGRKTEKLLKCCCGKELRS